MVDEFIYQFQSFCQYQAKLKQRTDQQLAFLRLFDKVWNVVGVLNYLQALIEKSMNLQILNKEKNYGRFAACALLVGGLTKWSLCTFTH
ncbi:unnamed protein product [Sphagnum balticum]